MLNRIITNLGSPSTAKEFKAWASDCGISIDYASVALERANGLLLIGLNPRLYDELKDYDGKWIDKLPKVVRVYALSNAEQQGTSPSS